MWPSDVVNPVIYWAYTSFVLVVFEIPIAILPYVNLFFKNDVGVLEVAKSIFLNLQVSIVPFKVVLFLTYHKKMRKIVEIFCSKSFSSYIQLEHKYIIQEGDSSTRRVFNYISLCLITGVLMTSSPLINLRDKPWLVEMWIPIDIKANWLNYFGVYLYTLIGKHNNWKLWRLVNFCCSIDILYND